MLRRIAIVVIVGLLVGPVWTREAVAVATRFSVLNYRPTTDRAEFQVIRQSRNLFQLQWHAGTQSVFGYRLLEERETPRRLIDRILVQHLLGGIGITDWLSVGLDWPFAVNNHFQSPTPVVAPGFANQFSLGDPRIEFKGAILNRYRSPVGVAVAPYFTVPLGKEAEFLGDETVSGGGLVIADAEFWRKLVVAINLGAEARRTVSFRNVQISSGSFLYGAAAAVRVTPQLDVSAEIFGRTPMKRMFKERAESPAEVIVGGHYKIGKSGLAVSAGGGVGLVHGAGAPLARAFAGVSYTRQTEALTKKQETLERTKYVTLKGESPVQWNIVELSAVCPGNPTQYDPTQHDPSCPKLYELREVAALILKCPSKAESFDPAAHDAGCAKVYTLRETLSPQEYATVYVLSTEELAARCPSDPTLYNTKLHSSACPKYFELREVITLASKCPARAEDFHPAKHDPNCPKVFEFREALAGADRRVVDLMSRADADDDGVLDLDDRCPRLAGVATARGCPEKTVLVTGGVVQPKVPVQFSFNSALLDAEAMGALAEIATWLTAHPEVRRVRIEGYADSIGSPRVNRWIASARANAVKNYLASQGVERERLKTVGLGEDRPLAPNTTPEGRAMNRRAIFLVIER